MNQKKSVGIKNILMLQAVVVIYTLNSIVAKFAENVEMLSFKFFLAYGLEVAILGVYAICWQQMIKKFDLSVAYANRAMAILWTALWALIIFKDTIGLKQAIGIGLVVIGTIVVNWSKKEQNKEETADD